MITSEGYYMRLPVHGLLGACLVGLFSLSSIGNHRSPNVIKENNMYFAESTSKS